MAKSFKTLGRVEDAVTGPVMTQIHMSNAQHFGSGKVRETFYHGSNTLLMTSTDRVSAFDVVMDEGVPGKGWILNHLSAFWFQKTKHIVDNHFLKIYDGHGDAGEGRSMYVERVEPLKVEAVVRGYLTGSGFKAYQRTGVLWGEQLPTGMKDGDKLPNVIFTPTSKAEMGHDMPMSKSDVADLIGVDDAEFIEKKAIQLYNFGHDFILRRGGILADTKFEFGKRENGDIILIDEALTPDSSRYWRGPEYEKGKLVSLDKQVLRDYLESTDWDKQAPPPTLPPGVIAQTAERYVEAFNMITGPELRT